ncbi:hypothetical protein A3C26_02410 [Candidatus Daviesbacteria bacterium RIFCSPHIGHO2_02_FULL_39_12]|uniref:Uncharacterized protein n=2 Tax=Candidatus Daviesiibacteriota TaxID=1752718 RepID=A0A1F5JAC5_9BACT|nr:MAG: hypothetical protein A3C26_02410 [Candidatus Daviesbacteria bacterium RIFCSPHIGHO2_02_FULL_39_12]OGE71709.1 MAG: hypothetical protein A3H40_01720 [Candidatus Daviesbacteria bacterium RIFCSPLOWO2_02_FULL_38_15]
MPESNPEKYVWRALNKKAKRLFGTDNQSSILEIMDLLEVRGTARDLNFICNVLLCTAESLFKRGIFSTPIPLQIYPKAAIFPVIMTVSVPTDPLTFGQEESSRNITFWRMRKLPPELYYQARNQLIHVTNLGLRGINEPEIPKLASILSNPTSPSSIRDFINNLRALDKI